MGGVCSRKVVKYRIVMLGLDQAGKTSLLQKAVIGDRLPSFPTSGFNKESLRIEIDEYDRTVILDIYDVGGRQKLHMLWPHYCRDTKGVIFVVDATDTDRMNDARTALFRILGNKDLVDVPLMVLANKRDVNDAMDKYEITDRLKLEQIVDRPWKVKAVSAVTGKGIETAMETLAIMMLRYN